MSLIALAALIAAASPVYLECEVSDGRRPPYTMSVLLSVDPGRLHVETRGSGFRTSSLALRISGEAWRWEDVRDGAQGTSRIDRQTLVYLAERGDVRATGLCRTWDDPDRRFSIWPSVR